MGDYLTFIYDGYYPEGGMNDFSKSFDNLEDSINHIVNNPRDCLEIMNSNIYNVKDGVVYEFISKSLEGYYKNCSENSYKKSIWENETYYMVQTTLKEYENWI